ncbi:MAG: putative addiction module antidote protein [Acidobacteria bacterium]|nr:MAG: putative addiction module antidote protein [Acidobacteriota bacterium]
MRTIKRTSRAKPFDAAEYLDSPEMIAAYINEALESEDASAIAVAIGTVARARGMSAVAEKAGRSRENLYRALGGEARPEFGTVIKVLHAVRIDLVAQPQGSKAA